MTEQSPDSLRFMELVSGILGGEPIALSSELQVMCDALMRARPDYLLLVDDQGSIRFATNACEELFGRGATALANESLVSLIAPPDRPLLEEFIRQQLTPLQGQTFAKVGPLDLRVIQVDPDTGATTLRWVAIRVASADLFGDSHASGASYFFSLTDITHREAEEEQILKKLNFDALTSLPSRYNILAQIEQHVERDSAGQLAPFHLVFFDLDRFKTINDALGHRLGDQFLAALCKRLQGFFSADQVLGRFGGDEFLLFLPQTQDLNAVSALCLEALDLLLQPIEIQGYTLSCGASFGIARYPDHGSTVDQLIQAADTAMYHVKSQGVGGCAVFDTSMNAERFSELELEQELREAVTREEMFAVYQPQVCLSTGDIKGVEALVRWQHPRMGVLTPATFLTLATQAGLMQEIDALVQRQAITQGGRWSEQGIEVDLSINCSAAQLESKTFLPELVALCSSSGFPLDRLKIELTEQTLVRQIEHAATNIQQARGLGIRVGIDDFGMGYSSLKYLRDFPVDLLKIDRSFIQDLQTDQDAVIGVSLVDAIIAMAKGLELTLIAEGVERPVQLAYLRAQGCDQAQGFFFAEACDAVQMTAMLKGPGFAEQLTD